MNAWECGPYKLLIVQLLNIRVDVYSTLSATSVPVRFSIFVFVKLRYEFYKRLPSQFLLVISIIFESTNVISDEVILKFPQFTAEDSEIVTFVQYEVLSSSLKIDDSRP